MARKNSKRRGRPQTSKMVRNQVHEPMTLTNRVNVKALHLASRKTVS